ncbi:MAG: PQQ-binding-like beta-propeller repeat protein [Nibricoccus sp.]
MNHNPLRFARAAVAAAFLCLHAFSHAAAPTPSISNPAVLWKFSTGKDVTAAPMVDRGVVYCGSTNGQFFALNADTGQQLWKFQANFPISSRAACEGDTVCFESGNTLYALDRATGLEKWLYVAKPYRPIASMDLTDYHRSSPVIADGIVYFGDDWGNLNGVSLTDGSPVFGYTTPAARPIRCAPAIHDGVVYFGDWEGDVFAVSLSDKKLRWQYRAPNVRPYYGAVVSDFLVSDGVLYFGSQHDTFAPLDIVTGKPVWSYTDPNKTYLPSTPLVHKGRVIIGTTIFTNSVLCLERGQLAWTFKAEGIFFTRPAIAGRTLIVNSSNFGKTGWLYLLDVETGALLNKLPIDKAMPSAPVVADGKIYLGAGDGCIYALSLSTLTTTTTEAQK